MSIYIAPPSDSGPNPGTVGGQTPAPILLSPGGTVGAFATIPVWWAVLAAGSNAQAPEGSTNFSDKRFPISRAIAPTDLLPVAFGAVRVGGSELFFGTTPGGYGDLIDGSGVIAICEGEIEAVDNFLVNGQALTSLSTDTGSKTVTNYTGAASDSKQDGVGEVFHGKDVTGFTNVAYTHFRLLDPHSNGWWAWLPNFSAGTYEWAADVRALKLYDPRADSTNGGSGSQRYATPSTWVYSRNPILIARYLLKRYGSLLDVQIDDVSVAAAATACDTMSLTCDIVFAAKTGLDVALGQVLQTCNGKKITTADGKTGFYLNVANAGAPVASFSEEDGDVWGLKYEWISARDRYTRVAVSFANKDADYKKDQTPDFDDPGIALGTIPIKAQVVDAPGINTLAAAIILRDYLYNIQAITFRASGTMNAKGIPLQEGEEIHLTTLKGVDVDFILNQIAGDEKGFFSFVAQPYDADVFGSTPISGSPPIVVSPPNPATAGNDITVTASSATRPVVVASPSTQQVYNLFQLVTYTLPPDGPSLRELRVRGFRGTGAGSKTWEDMVGLELVVPLVGNEPQPDGTHFTLSHPGVIKTIRTLTYDPFGRLKNTAEVVGPTRIIVKTVTTAFVLSAGVTVDVAGSSTSVDESLAVADIGRGTIVERPSGTINGVNRDFTLSKTPSSSRILLIADSVGGAPMPLIGGYDYSRSGAAVRFAAAANKPSNNLLAVYPYGDIADGGGTPELSLPIGTAATWVNHTIAYGTWRRVAWSPTLGLFAALDQAGTSAAIATSPDGVTWTPRTTPTTPHTGWGTVVWGNGMFLVLQVAGSSQDGVIMSSPDGITWTQHAATVAPIGYDHALWAPGLNLFVGVVSVNYGDSMDAITSPDGLTWTKHVSFSAGGWNAVAWSPDLALLVAVGSSLAASSSDGTTWTSRTISARSWRSVAWSPELGLFVASSDVMGSGAFATSPDGVTWTDRTCSALGNWYSVVWSPVRRLFVAVSNSTDSHCVATSPDGIIWTVQATPSPMNGGGWTQLAVADSPDMIVAIGAATPWEMLSLA
jgi:hypothetical protein